MNEKKLRIKMMEMDLSVKEMCEYLEIDKSTFYRKMGKGSEFTRKELGIIIAVLHLTDDEIADIFFEEKVS